MVGSDWTIGLDGVSLLGTTPFGLCTGSVFILSEEGLQPTVFHLGKCIYQKSHSTQESKEDQRRELDSILNRVD